MAVSHRLHRKVWELCYVSQVLYENGMLAPGKRGLCFAVGREPLPALFASFGCSILATDLHTDQSESGWIETNQHAENLEVLQHPDVCDPQLFRERVSFRFVDMNNIPEDLSGFDFVWSCCSFEHLGSITKGKRFIRRMTRCLKPGGIAIHTTEFNVSSNTQTVETGGSVIFRQQDFEEMIALLRKAGHTADDCDYSPGTGPADLHVDQPPYPQEVHLKLNLFGYTSTSGALIIRAGQDNGIGMNRFDEVSWPRRLLGLLATKRNLKR